MAIRGGGPLLDATTRHFGDSSEGGCGYPDFTLP
jgi:hypothetical protein